jgi:murein DD-endopeptidase MepM/ murein hydrolase activator NlpD
VNLDDLKAGNSGAIPGEAIHLELLTPEALRVLGKRFPASMVISFAVYPAVTDRDELKRTTALMFSPAVRPIITGPGSADCKTPSRELQALYDRSRGQLLSKAKGAKAISWARPALTEDSSTPTRATPCTVDSRIPLVADLGPDALIFPGWESTGRGVAPHLVGHKVPPGSFCDSQGRSVAPIIMNTRGVNTFPATSLPHAGVDLAAPEGTVILAPTSGVVTCGSTRSVDFWPDSGGKIGLSHVIPHGAVHVGANYTWDADGQEGTPPAVRVEAGTPIGMIIQEFTSPHVHISASSQESWATFGEVVAEAAGF